VQVGDLVRYDHHEWADWYGIILREISGTDERIVVMWNKNNSAVTSTPKRDLEIISASR